MNMPELNKNSNPEFTFHSGYILIEVRKVEKIGRRKFTFHSGYILIVMTTPTCAALSSFTFHSGYILINDGINAFREEIYLHSTLVIFLF